MEFGTHFDMGTHQKKTCSNPCGPQKVTIIQTCLGTIRFGPVRADKFARSSNLRTPRFPLEAKKMRNTICNRVHKISAEAHFLWTLLVNTHAFLANRL